MEPTLSNNNFWKFLLNFSLTNAIWIIPVIIFGGNGLIFTSIFYPFLLCYGYLSWLQYYKRKPLLLQRVAKFILRLYYLVVLIFLVLTGIATYEGIVNVFGLTSDLHLFFAGVFAVGIPLALLAITLFIKERRSPSFILAAFLLYMLFDSMTALPYNFLFFYEHLKIAANVEYDREKLTVVIDACDSVLTPRYTKSVSGLSQYKNQRQNHIVDENLNAARKFTHDSSGLELRLSKGIITQEKYENEFSYITRKYRPKDVSTSTKENNTLSVLQDDSSSTGKLLEQLSQCKALKMKLDNISKTDSAATVCSIIKVDLIPICNGSRDSSLQSLIKLLYPKKPSSLESIKQLYNMIGNWVSGNRETGVGATVGADYDKETAMLMKMSLSSSLVIDILPLLLSLLYAKFKRDE